jgi:hypothetical protein
MPNQVGAGVYRGIRWWILRDDDKKCSVYISPPFPIFSKSKDCNERSDAAYSPNRFERNVVELESVLKEDLKDLMFINGIISTPFIYKRRECREIARILIIRLWNNY